MEKSSIFEKFNLSGQVSIITGGSTDLGFDMACALAQAGSDMVLTSRQYERAQRATEKIKKELTAWMPCLSRWIIAIISKL